MFGLSELAIILIIIAVVVGVKKLPELTRSAGKAARILKAEKRALGDQDAGGTAGERPPRVVRGEVVRPDGPAGERRPPEN
ncbi:twin-arginine translocase TatA/TatE family subunit [Streptomyces sp. NPDC005876]|uniref:twin-arginine translocase TatA/TatE family subunit n=1 Tax=unclassified Streptomyces TaxID=2593676 RepID=UPI00340973C0